MNANQEPVFETKLRQFRLPERWTMNVNDFADACMRVCSLKEEV